MEGVTILNTVYEYAMNFSGWWIAGFLIAAAVLFILFIAFLDCLSNIPSSIFFFLWVGCTITALTLNCCHTETDEIIGTKYQVIIEDSVSLNDFYDYYEILDQEGQIYTVREIKAE